MGSSGQDTLKKEFKKSKLPPQSFIVKKFGSVESFYSQINATICKLDELERKYPPTIVPFIIPQFGLGGTPMPAYYTRDHPEVAVMRTHLSELVWLQKKLEGKWFLKK